MNDYGVALPLLDAVTRVAVLGLNWLVQSSVLLAVGLSAGWLLRRRGPAVQSVVHRTTLAAVLICPVVSCALAQAGVGGWPVPVVLLGRFRMDRRRFGSSLRIPRAADSPGLADRPESAVGRIAGSCRAGFAPPIGFCRRPGVLTGSGFRHAVCLGGTSIRVILGSGTGGGRDDGADANSANVHSAALRRDRLFRDPVLAIWVGGLVGTVGQRLAQTGAALLHGDGGGPGDDRHVPGTGGSDARVCTGGETQPVFVQPVFGGSASSRCLVARILAG